MDMLLTRLWACSEWSAHVCCSLVRSALCAGSIIVPVSTPTNFTFSMDSDDGTQLYIDGKLVIDHSGTVLSPSPTHVRVRFVTGYRRDAQAWMPGLGLL